MDANICSTVPSVNASAHLPDVQDNGLLLRVCFGVESPLLWALLVMVTPLESAALHDIQR